MATEEDRELKSAKAMIRSVLISEKDGVPASRFMNDYQEITGEQIPYRKFGFSSMEQFIRSIPDVVFVRPGKNGELTYFAVADESTAHIQKLVFKQKSKKSKPLRKGPARIPKAHSQFRKSFTHKGTRRHTAGFSIPFRLQHHSPPGVMGGGFFSSASVLPLIVTVRNTGEHGDQRLIERRAFNITGGKNMAARALKAAVGDKGHERKQPAKQYQVPPRFQRHNSGSSTSPDKQTNKPIAVVTPSLQKGAEGPAATESELPDGVKEWVSNMLKEFPNGLWSTRFVVLYKENFNKEAPSTLIDIISEWTDIAHVEFNTVANRHVLRPPTSGEHPPQQPVPHLPKASSPQSPKEIKPVWQDFTVPAAELLPTDMSSYVYVSYCVDPSHFYVQDENSCAEDIAAMLEETSKDQAVPRMTDLHAGVCCAALYSEDNNWYRAHICYARNENDIEVYFIDYGNMETVPLSNIRSLTKETAEIPAQAINCTLFGLKPLSDTSWTKEALNVFNNFVHEKKIEAVTYSYAEGQCVVELFTEEAGDESLNQRLLESGLAGTYLKVEENEGEPQLDLPDSEYIEVVVAYMDLKTCCIRLVGPDFSETLEVFEEQLGTQFRTAESSGKPKNLAPDSICIASVDMLYNRVRILKQDNVQAQCLFLDHGYTEWVPLDKLQPLDPEVNKTVPYQAIHCSLAGLEQFMKLPTTMRELIQMSYNKTCMAEIDCRDPLTVMLYDTSSDDDVNINKEIAKKLAAEGAKVDLDIFNASTDSGLSGGSGASTPYSQASVSGISGMEQLQSAAEQLSMKVGDGGDVSQPAAGGAVERKQQQQQQQQLQQQQTPHQQLQQQQQSQQQPPLYTWGSKTPLDKPIHGSSSTFAAMNPLDIAEFKPPHPPSPAALSPAAYSASCSPIGAASQSVDFNVTYHTWPLPGYVPIPRVEEFTDMHILWISDPSNFVVLPHMMLQQLDKLMNTLNTKFQVPKSETGDASQNQPAVVSGPQVNHLYMTIVDGMFYRAIYKGAIEDGLHVFCPDYCTHHLVSHNRLYFLPRQFWSLPFAAYKASLHGVKPIASRWLESCKYKFVEMVQHKTLVALIKSKGDLDLMENDIIQVPQQQLSLHLVDTSDSERDVVIADALVDSGLAEYVAK